MSEERGDRNRRPRGRKPRRKVCQFCVDKVEHIDYKDIPRLRRFLTERGNIMPRRMSLKKQVRWIGLWFLIPKTENRRNNLCKPL